MDFLFDNPLASMYGPYFLLLYAVFNVTTLGVFYVLKGRLDQTDRYALPPIPTEPDPYEIAFLRGGKNEMTRSVVFALVKKNLLKISSDGRISHFYLTVDPPAAEKQFLRPIEQAALGWFGGAPDAREIFKSRNGTLPERLRPYWESYEARLEAQNFIVGDETKAGRRRLQLYCASAIAGLGLYKFAAAVLHGYTNVWGLIILCAVGVGSLILAGRLPRQTKLGKAYLDKLQLAFEQLKSPQKFISPAREEAAADLPRKHSQPQPGFAVVDPVLLSVGVFGGGVLVGTTFDDYNQAFQKAQQPASTGSSCSSGCGSSSCSSGGGGGGDGGGGGGSCGGGCGGGGCGGGCGG